MKILLFILTFSLAFSVNAQQKDSLKIKEIKNNIHASLMGELVLGGGICYERTVLKKGMLNLSVSFGIGLSKAVVLSFNAPVSTLLLLGKRKHFATFTIGANNVFATKPNPPTKAELEAIKNDPMIPTDNFIDIYKADFNASVGYTYIGKKGLLIRPELTGIRYIDNALLPPTYGFVPKLSIGYAF